MSSLSKSKSIQGPVDWSKAGPGLEGGSPGKGLPAGATGGGRGVSQKKMRDLGGWVLGRQYGDWLGPKKTWQALKGLVIGHLGAGRVLYIHCGKTWSL